MSVFFLYNTLLSSINFASCGIWGIVLLSFRISNNISSLYDCFVESNLPPFIITDPCTHVKDLVYHQVSPSRPNCYFDLLALVPGNTYDYKKPRTEG